MNYNHLTEFITSHRDSLDLVIDLIPTPLFIKDLEGRYIDCNTAFTEFMSISREMIIGKSVYEIWNTEEAEVFFAKDKILLKEGGIQIYETRITSPIGKTRIVQFHKQVFTDTTGAIAGFVGVIFDITEKKALEQQLARQAVIDDLTGLPNRRGGMDKLEALHRDSRRKKRPYCLAMMDLDHFKRVNDQYGHHKGDIVLREFAQLAKSMLRGSDVCFRYGGEEFVLLLPETRLEDGRAVAERLRGAWSEKRVPLQDRKYLQSTISIGMTQYGSRDVSYEQLLLTSDKALYEAKNNGRNRCVAI